MSLVERLNSLTILVRPEKSEWVWVQAYQRPGWSLSSHVYSLFLSAKFPFWHRPLAKFIQLSSTAFWLLSNKQTSGWQAFWTTRIISTFTFFVFSVRSRALGELPTSAPAAVCLLIHMKLKSWWEQRYRLECMPQVQWCCPSPPHSFSLWQLHFTQISSGRPTTRSH